METDKIRQEFTSFLVTTAIEETWPSEGNPIVFLGDWCKQYSKKSNWANLNSTTVPYHWDDREKFHDDYQFLKKIYEELLSEISKYLNEYHKVDYGIRYWRIIVGPWLGYFIQILFDRWVTLNNALSSNKILGAKVIDNNIEHFIPLDMSEFIQQFISNEWNEFIWGELLSFTNIKIDFVKAKELNAAKQKLIKPKSGIFSTLFRNAVIKLLNWFGSNHNYFFLTTYLPLTSNIVIQLRLHQIPIFWRSIPTPKSYPDIKARYFPQINEVRETDFLTIARYFIFRHIPTSYLEGYSKLIAATEGLCWPKNPGVVFTSNSWLADDVFKVWAASKVEKGSQLVIGQHGGNYGIALDNFTEDHQVAIADKFLTWGWDDKKQSKIIPVGNFKDYGRRQSTDEHGFALMVEMSNPQFSYHMYSAPIASQWLEYFEDQCLFVSNLPKFIQEKLCVRLSFPDFNWHQRQRWLARNPEIIVDDGLEPISRLIARSRIYISTYNATTYLESLSLNVPTIIFWNTNHWEMRDGAKPLFNKLKEVGIFHETPESAAAQLRMVWDDINSWWSKTETQNARQEFCRAYSNTEEDILDNLLEELVIRIS